MAALGIHALDRSRDAGSGTSPTDGRPNAPETGVVTAKTYGRTRTRRNFERTGSGRIQFTSDPREFVEAALTIEERSTPVLPNADAWVDVTVARVNRDTDENTETEIHTWELTPTDHEVLTERVQTINRGFGAVIDATVAASRLDVPGYEEAQLLERLTYFADTVTRCGGPREREAFARIDEVTDWRRRRSDR